MSAQIPCQGQDQLPSLHTNDYTNNKKRCCSCRAWRDRIAPLTTHTHGNVCNKAGGVGNINCNAAGGVARISLLFCSSENGSPNKVSPCKVGTSPDESGEKRKSPSQGNGGVVIQPLLLTRLPQDLLPTHSTIRPNPPLQCRGVYEGFFGKAFPLLQTILCITLSISYSSGR
jgi:hypothetical protein